MLRLFVDTHKQPMLPWERGCLDWVFDSHQNWSFFVSADFIFNSVFGYRHFPTAPNNVAFKNNQSCQKAIGRIFNSSISPKRLDRVNQQLVVDQPVVRSFKNTPVLLIYPTFDQMIIRPTHSLPSTWSLVNFIWLLSSKRFLIPELHLKFETTLIFLAM